MSIPSPQKRRNSPHTQQPRPPLTHLLLALGLLLSGVTSLACPGSIDDPAPFFAARERIAIVDSPPQENPPEVPDTIPTEQSAEPMTEQFTENPLPTGCVPQEIFARSCLDSGCHNQASSAGSLDLESAGIAQRILSQPAVICKGSLLVDPNAPLEGIFWRKMAGPVPCGAPMPLGKPALTQDEKDCLQAWLLAISTPSTTHP